MGAATSCACCGPGISKGDVDVGRAFPEAPVPVQPVSVLKGAKVNGPQALGQSIVKLAAPAPDIIPPAKGSLTARFMLSEYALGPELGQGAFGVVYACAKIGEEDDGWKYAVKMVDKVETPVKEIQEEADVTKYLAHPNVVGFRDVFYEKLFVYIVLDKYAGGDLISCMMDHWETKGKIPPEKNRHIVRQMAVAIEHMHRKGVVHRDIKGDNFLTDRKEFLDPKCKVSLSDFGTAIRIPVEKRLTAQVGTKHYWPPEFFQENYGFKVDEWALGVITFGLVDGRFPYKIPEDVLKKDVVLPKCPKHCQDLIKKLLERKEKNRIDAATVLDEPWLAEDSGFDVQVVQDGPMSQGDRSPGQDGPRSTGKSSKIVKEGGANAGQDERRKELVGRLKKKNDKRKSIPAKELHFTAKEFEVKGVHGGKPHKYQWCSPEKVDKLHVGHAFKETDQAHNDSRVDVETIAKMLKEHDIDMEPFGKGEAKTFLQFATEVHTGAAVLMLDAAEHKKLVRVVDVVLLRVCYHDLRGLGKGKLFLVEASEEFADGRRRGGLNRLPGTKKEPHESTHKTASRIVTNLLGLVGGFQVKFDFKHRELFEEEEESRSYPGVRTVYRKEIVEGLLIKEDCHKQDENVLRAFGLDGEEPERVYTHKDSHKNTKEFNWLSEDECMKNKVKLRAPTEDEGEVSALVRAPVGFHKDDLSIFLRKHGIDPLQFDGCVGTRDLKDFSEELVKGEASLMVEPASHENAFVEKVVRVVDVVLLQLTRSDTGEQLVEMSESFHDGVVFHLDRLPGVKRRPDENQFATIKRVLKNNLRIRREDENLVHIDERRVVAIQDKEESPSYPGMTTIYKKRIISAELYLKSGLQYSLHPREKLDKTYEKHPAMELARRLA